MISCIHLETIVQRAHNAIHQIHHHPVESVNKIFCVIHRIDIYSVDGVIQPSNNRGLGYIVLKKFSVPLEWRHILTGHFLWAPAPNSSERLSIECRKTKSVEISTTKTTNLSEGKYRRNQWEQNPRMQNKQTARMAENAREQVAIVVRLASDWSRGWRQATTPTTVPSWLILVWLCLF